MSILPSKSTQASESSNLQLPKFVTDPDPEIYLHGRFVCLDLETYGPDAGDAGNPESGIVLAAWYEGSRLGGISGVLRQGDLDISVARGDEFSLGELLAAVQRADFVVAHNAKYELKWLHRMGVDLRRVLPYCTQIGEYVRNGNRRTPLGLDQVARRYGVRGKEPFVAKLIKGGVDTRDIPQGPLERYCRADVEATLHVFAQQRALLKQNGLLAVTYARNLATPALAAIEFEGMQVDGDRVYSELERVRKAHGDAKEQVDRCTGGINFRSSKQLREFLYDKLKFDQLKDWRGNPVVTDGGAPKTDAGTIQRLKATTAAQREFQAAFKPLAPLKKALQILETVEECVKNDLGRLTANFHQSVTQTHRLSSSGGKYKLQFHNFPRAFKRLFRARRDGWLICEADAPQLEFRVAVDLGCDKQGLEDILRGVDVHQFTASVMGLDRTPAKAFTFKPLYGGTSGTPAERAYYDAFRKKYSNVYDTQLGWVYSVLRDKALRIPSGLIFYWPDTELTKTGYITNTPSIFNYPVQSFATADIIPLTLALVWHKLKGKKISIVNTVHDSIISEVHPDDLDDYRKILIESFTQDIYWMLDKLYGYKFTVPLGVGIKFGKFWGEGEEEKHERHGTADFGKAVGWKGSLLVQAQ